MNTSINKDSENIEIARRWCVSKGDGWRVRDTAGRGGTAPVFTIDSPDGERAFKLYDAKFSEGEIGRLSEVRVKQQVALGNHECPYLIKVYDGGRFEERLFILMNKAPGTELEKCLKTIPRNKIRLILDQVAQACIFLRSKGLCHRDIKSANIFISDDFNTVTLLDISTMRDINDPVGIGTDHGGQLPVIATTRYCAPEYLFRLVEPSPELWHGLDIYQLGGLIHDLIMQEPLFEAEYLLSQENRYRFAWIVATQDPIVQAQDVEYALVLLARRALDKDWHRRRKLRLDDFLNSAQAQQLHGLEALGLNTVRTQTPAPSGQPNNHRKITDVSKEIEEVLRVRLQEKGITATHKIEAAQNDSSKRIKFGWNGSNGNSENSLADIVLTVELTLRETEDKELYTVSVSIGAKINNLHKEEATALPEISGGGEVAIEISNQVIAVLGDIAAKLLTHSNEE